MQIIQINTVYKVGSTGKIAAEIQERAKENGMECIVAYRYAEKDKNYPNTLCISSWLDCHIHNRLARVFWLGGHFSYLLTKRFLSKIKKSGVDVLHLHNLHGNYINLPLLFKFIKRNNIKTVWTLHDCWSFTGYCAYFDMTNCDKWRTECVKCPMHKSAFEYDHMHRLKKKWFNGISDMTIVTPSLWLADLVKQSCLKNYPVKVINNGIDLSVFKPRESDFREKYNLQDKFILLGVAFDWGPRKGLDVFCELAKRLDDRFRIVLVGTNDEIDKTLPSNVISIHRTNNQQELAEIYSAADLLVNPTREDNYPTVNMESIACGTPVITFKTGGSPEIPDASCGAVVQKDDIDSMETEIIRICSEKPFSEAACLKRATDFDKNKKFDEYIELYKRG